MLNIAKNLKLPDAILAQHMAVLGKTGSGKTSTAKLFIEHVASEGARVCVLDPIKSDWWGLASNADGKKAGLPFQILGGPRGHVPLHSSAGKAIAEIVSDGRLPLSIIDMAEFAPGGQAQFFVDFVPMLIRKMKGVVYLVIEEAHLFAPKERSGIGQESMAIHWAKTMATAGRSKGIRLILLTQRTQALHNALLGSCDTIIAHRLTAPADQLPVVKWLKANVDAETVAKVENSLSSVKTGTGWVCSGEAKFNELVAFPRIKTYDNTATPTGEGSEHAVKMAPVDTDRLIAIIGKAAEEAKAEDPKELRKEIANLKRQLSTKAPIVDDKALERAQAQGKQEADKEWRPKFNELQKAIGPLQKRLEQIAKLAHLNGEVPKVEAPAAVSAAPVQRQVVRRQVAPRTVPPDRIAESGAWDRLPIGEEKILAALIQYPDGLDRSQITVLTTYKRSTRDRYLQFLQAKGLVVDRGGKLFATEEGIAALPDAEPLPTGTELQQYWLSKLPVGEEAILKCLIERHPQAMTRDELSEATGYKRSTRDRYLQFMQSKQIVVAESDGVRASDTLF